MDMTLGHPDYTQRLCSHLFDIIAPPKKPSLAIDLDNSLLQQAMKTMIEACSSIFIPEWQSYPLRQQQGLSLLAEYGPMKRIPAVYLAEYDMGQTSFNTALKELLKKGAVRRDPQGRYELSDPIFARWILRATHK
ncbi:MAG: hypothetical protein GY864_10945 [Desulfobacterales bacterium]|nr:hypothetical protein [Desulfobacterales bacterium]